MTLTSRSLNKILSLPLIYALTGLTILSLVPRPATAGAVSGGGGKAIVCRDHQDHIRSVQTLDLWEARELLHESIPHSGAPLRKQINAAIERLKFLVWAPGQAASVDDQGHETLFWGAEVTADDLRRYVSAFLTNNSDVDRLHGKTLSSVDDSLEDAFPDGCHPEQVVIYHDGVGEDPHILINQDLVDHMSLQDQAALYVHEAVYRFLRATDREANSLRARRAVGLAFAGHRFHDVREFIPDDFILCLNADLDEPTTAVAIYPIAASGSGHSYVVRPLYLQGVSLTDFDDSYGNVSLPATGLSELLSDVIVPTASMPIADTTWGSITLNSYFVDREISSRIETVSFLGSKSFALAITQTTSPWSADPNPARTYLSCRPGDKADYFPAPSIVHKSGLRP